MEFFILSVHISEKLKVSQNEMIEATMEAIADFCRNDDTTNLSNVRVVVCQDYMVTSYLQYIETATEPGSSVSDMIRTPLRYFGNAMHGIIIYI